jgi:hypothetical protein
MISFKLIAFILAMLVYAIAFVVKKLQEQAAIKRAKDEHARRRVDALRTGRLEDLEAPAPQVISSAGGSPAPLSHQEATRRLQELAEHRRQQLEELRRRAAAQARGAAQTASAPIPARVAPPAIPRQAVTSRPRPPVRTAPASVPRPAPPVPRAAPRPQPVESARRTPAKVPPSPSRRALGSKRRTPEQIDDTERRAHLEADRAQGVGRQSTRTMPTSTPVAPPARVEVASLLVPMGKGRLGEWRRIIMLREVLGRPVALRDQEPGAA